MTYPKKQAEAQGIFQKTGGFVQGNMTLRDYFAAKAMQADMTQGIHEEDFLETACRAYKMADDMLKAREA